MLDDYKCITRLAPHFCLKKHIEQGMHRIENISFHVSTMSLGNGQRSNDIHFDAYNTI